jgi:hypothetical protein
MTSVRTSIVQGKKSGQSWAALDSRCSGTKGFDYAETGSLRGVAIFVHNARRAFETGSRERGHLGVGLGRWEFQDFGGHNESNPIDGALGPLAGGPEAASIRP